MFFEKEASCTCTKYQPMWADMGPKFLLLVNFLHFDGPVSLINQPVVIQDGYCGSKFI